MGGGGGTKGAKRPRDKRRLAEEMVWGETTQILSFDAIKGYNVASI